jgi:CheY-like chemotaxis protein
MTAIEPNEPILLVEDSPADCDAVMRAWQELEFPSPIYHCADGEEALDFLYHRGAYADSKDAPRPALILLDLNLPGTDGREVLEQVKQDEDLRSIPVIVFTTSLDDKDVEECYRAGANSYLHKPISVQGLLKALGRLKDFWLETAILPKGREHHERQAAQDTHR